MTLPRSSVQLIIAAVAWCGDYGRPTLFKIAIACGFKLTIHHVTSKHFVRLPESGSGSQTLKNTVLIARKNITALIKLGGIVPVLFNLVSPIFTQVKNLCFSPDERVFTDPDRITSTF